MRRAILTVLASVILAVMAQAQSKSRIDFGLHGAGDRDRAYKDQELGLSGHLLFRFGSMALDANADWTFHAPKTGAKPPDGKTIATTFLLRRYLFGDNVYLVFGVDINKLSSVLLDTTATSAATGLGIELGDFRLQGAYEPPDFSSGQTLSHYKLEGEYLARFELRGRKLFVSLKPQATVVRFDRAAGVGTVTAERVEMKISIGRFIF